MKNFVFISPTFPPSYYQFPKAWKALGGTSLCIGEDSYESLSQEMKDSTDEYYQVYNLQDYDQVYRAVAWFAHKHGKIDWLESNNEFWLEQDARLRTDFNITSGDKTDDVMRFKLKSNMKAFYERAGVPTARYHLVNTYENGKAFADLVGYPLIVKPDDGVGANATWKIKNEEDLKDFYDNMPSVQYIMEEYIPGYIVSFDGITDQDGKIIFKTSHMFPDPIMNIVNDQKELIYYSVRQIPKDLEKYGSAVIKEFGIRGRFFHTEYFRLTEDKPGLGSKGDLVGLEVNMRPPGGFTPDYMNFANDINVYDIYARMCMDNTVDYTTDRPYYCVHIGRRDGLDYKYSHEEVLQKFADNVVMSGRMPELLGVAMGNEYFAARFRTKKEIDRFSKYVFAKKASK